MDKDTLKKLLEAINQGKRPEFEAKDLYSALMDELTQSMTPSPTEQKNGVWRYNRHTTLPSDTYVHERRNEWEPIYSVDKPEPIAYINSYTGEEKTAMSEIIATVEAKYDYSVDANFIASRVEIDNIRTYDPAVLKRGLDGYSRSDEVKSFKDLVFKSWGKVVDAIDTSKSGGYCFPGSRWIHGRNTAEIVQRRSDLDEFTSVVNAGTHFSAEADEEVILLSVSYSQRTVVILLINRNVAGRLKNTDETLLFPTNDLSVHLGGVKVPFPFNQYGDYNTPIKYHNTVDLEVRIQVHPAYGVALIGDGDFLNKTAKVEYPEGSVLKRWEGEKVGLRNPYHSNVFTEIAQMIEIARDQGLLTLTGKVTAIKGVRGKDNRFVVQVMNGAQPKPEVAKAVEEFEPENFPVPFGLTELPKPPGGYRWIGDVSGLLLLVDKKGTRAYFPYEVYDVPALVDALLKVEKELDRKHLQPNAATIEMRKQIGLIQMVFQHQAKLLQGLAFNFEALGAGEEFLPEGSIVTDSEDD